MKTSIIANHHISPAIVDLIASAKKHVDIVSPYIQLWGHLEREIKAAIKRGVDIALFIRADQRKQYEELLQGLAAMGVAVYEIEFLHAKVYLSEASGIVSSMNLYDFSTKNSEEIAVVSQDSEFIKALDDYVGKLAEDKAKDITGSLRGRKTMKAVGGVLKAAASKVADMVVGDSKAFCIRCKAEIEYNPDKPLCAKCYKSWKKFADDTYSEKYCHDCGKKSKTSVAKPVCYECFKASK